MRGSGAKRGWAVTGGLGATEQVSGGPPGGRGAVSGKSEWGCSRGRCGTGHCGSEELYAQPLGLDGTALPPRASALQPLMLGTGLRGFLHTSGPLSPLAMAVIRSGRAPTVGPGRPDHPPRKRAVPSGC